MLLILRVFCTDLVLCHKLNFYFSMFGIPFYCLSRWLLRLAHCTRSTDPKSTHIASSRSYARADKCSSPLILDRMTQILQRINFLQSLGASIKTNSFSINPLHLLPLFSLSLPAVTNEPRASVSGS